MSVSDAERESECNCRFIVLGLVMDIIYQGIELRQFYPVGAVIVALLFAFVPYVIMRGPALCIARRWVAATSHQTV